MFASRMISKRLSPSLRAYKQFPACTSRNFTVLPEPLHVYHHIPRTGWGIYLPVTMSYSRKSASCRHPLRLTLRPPQGSRLRAFTARRGSTRSGEDVRSTPRKFSRTNDRSGRCPTFSLARAMSPSLKAVDHFDGSLPAFYGWLHQRHHMLVEIQRLGSLVRLLLAVQLALDEVRHSRCQLGR